MQTTRQVVLKRSKIHVGGLMAISALAALSSLLVEAPWPFKLACLLLLATFFAHAYRHACLQAPDDIVAIYWADLQASGDSWVIELACGQQLPVALVETSSTLSAKLVTLVFKHSNSAKRFGRSRYLKTCLFRDSASDNELRALRLVLNFLPAARSSA